jgi:hypothetical protein
MKDNKVESEGKSHGGKKPHVAPWWHSDQGLVLRQAEYILIR